MEKRIALTGGIACGKSLVARFLNELGVETIDADDIVHELIPDPAERRRIAAEVFSDPAKRRELEKRLHPLVKDRIAAFFARGRSEGALKPGATTRPRIAIIPLLFETGWDADFDYVVTVASSRELQIKRMLTTRGYSPSEAQARLDAQLPVEEKASRSDYVIRNDGSPEELKAAVEKFILRECAT